MPLRSSSGSAVVEEATIREDLRFALGVHCCEVRDTES